MTRTSVLAALFAALCFACSPTRAHDHDEDDEGHEANGEHAEAGHGQGGLEELMEEADEHMGALSRGRFDRSPEGLAELASEARELSEGYMDLAGEHRPTDTKDDWVGFAKDTSGFWGQVADAAGKDAATVQELFKSPRELGRRYCGRCHDVYKRQW